MVNAWFWLVQNMIDRYVIQEGDIYNFDETGFLMGMLSSAKVVTSSERRGRPHQSNWQLGMGHSDPGCVCRWLNRATILCCQWKKPPHPLISGQPIPA